MAEEIAEFRRRVQAAGRRRVVVVGEGPDDQREDLDAPKLREGLRGEGVRLPGVDVVKRHRDVGDLSSDGRSPPSGRPARPGP